jgi:hypothetical protein
MHGRAWHLQVGLSELFEIVEENKVPYKKTG